MEYASIGFWVSLHLDEDSVVTNNASDVFLKRKGKKRIRWLKPWFTISLLGVGYFLHAGIGFIFIGGLCGAEEKEQKHL